MSQSISPASMFQLPVKNLFDSTKHCVIKFDLEDKSICTFIMCNNEEERGYFVISGLYQQLEINFEINGDIDDCFGIIEFEDNGPKKYLQLLSQFYHDGQRRILKLGEYEILTPQSISHLLL